MRTSCPHCAFGGIPLIGIVKQLKPASRLIYLIVFLIFIACLLMNGPMRPGLPVDDSTALSRMQFIAENSLLWTMSWCVWMMCALGLYLFCALFCHRLTPSTLTRMGLVFVGIGLVPDLIAEVLYAFVLPYSLHLSISPVMFQLIEFTASRLTGFLGNGLYNLGGLLLTLAAIRQRTLPDWVAYWGMLAWLLGIGLSISIALNALAMAELFTATSMVLSTLWMLIVAHTVIQHD